MYQTASFSDVFGFPSTDQWEYIGVLKSLSWAALNDVTHRVGIPSARNTESIRVTYICG